jgi:hypothetical protein
MTGWEGVAADTESMRRGKVGASSELFFCGNLGFVGCFLLASRSTTETKPLLDGGEYDGGEPWRYDRGTIMVAKGFDAGQGRRSADKRQGGSAD